MTGDIRLPGSKLAQPPRGGLSALQANALKLLILIPDYSKPLIFLVFLQFEAQPADMFFRDFQYLQHSRGWEAYAMCKKNLYVWAKQEHGGPFSVDEIKNKLSKGEISYVDYVWLNDESAWTMLAHYFASDFPSPTEYPKALAQQQTSGESPKLKEFDKKAFEGGAGISNEPIWFVYKNGQKMGPYRYLEFVQLLQKNECTRDDFIWKPGMDDWQRVNTVYEYSKEILEKLENMKDSGKYGLYNIFVKRRFPRVPYDSEVIIHDNSTVIFGEAISLSEGGAFINVSNPSHQRGDRLKLHFTPGGVKVPFNCLAEIINVSRGDTPGYTVKFIYLEEEDRKRVSEYAYAAAKDGKPAKAA